VVSNNNSDTLDFLLRNKFSSLFYDDKLFVKDLKRPRPAMSNLVISKADSSNRGFCVSCYEKCKWITGSEIRNRLFCGRVYFFLINVQVRGTNCTGFNHRKEIGRALQKHGISKDHTQGLLKFKLFGRKQNIANVLDNAHRQSVINWTIN
jgi:hypothetical protein